MTEVHNQDREYGIEGEPDSDIPGGGVAPSGQVTMEKHSETDEKVTTTPDDGSDADAGDGEDSE